MCDCGAALGQRLDAKRRHDPIVLSDQRRGMWLLAGTKPLSSKNVISRSLATSFVEFRSSSITVASFASTSPNRLTIAFYYQDFGLMSG
jgi:hypothetical protein